MLWFFIYSFQWKHCLTELLCCELRPYISIICVYFVEKCILSTVLSELHWLGGFWFIKSLCGKQHLLSSTASSFESMHLGLNPGLNPSFRGVIKSGLPHNLVQKDLHPPHLTANKTSSYRAVCDLAQWRSGAAQDRTLEICISIFSIAVHFPVVLGRPLNFPHSYPLVQE